jgi:hypothetical protein
MPLNIDYGKIERELSGSGIWYSTSVKVSRDEKFLFVVAKCYCENKAATDAPMYLTSGNCDNFSDLGDPSAYLGFAYGRLYTHIKQTDPETNAEGLKIPTQTYINSLKMLGIQTSIYEYQGGFSQGVQYQEKLMKQEKPKRDPNLKKMKIEWLDD